jgi:hypothetical protein
MSGPDRRKRLENVCNNVLFGQCCKAFRARASARMALNRCDHGNQPDLVVQTHSLEGLGGKLCNGNET